MFFLALLKYIRCLFRSWRFWFKQYTITAVCVGKHPDLSTWGGSCFHRTVIVLLYFCQCFVGHLPCGGKLGCSAGNNRVVSWQCKFCQCFIGYLPYGGKLGCSAGINRCYYTSLTSHWLKLNHMTWNNFNVLWKLTQTGNN